jgi:hypothetical protein
MLSVTVSETDPAQMPAEGDPGPNGVKGTGVPMQTRGKPDAIDGTWQMVPAGEGQLIPNQVTVTVCWFARPMQGPTLKPRLLKPGVLSPWSMGRQADGAGPHDPSHWTVPSPQREP